MKVRIIQRPTGSVNGQQWPAVGEVIDLPEVSALSMLNAGQVSAVRDEPKVEAAVRDTKPTQARTSAKRRKRG